MENKTLTEKLAHITQEIGAIKKEKKPGSTVSYAYRGIDDVMNKLNPLLGKHGITLQSKILAYDLRVREFKKFNSYKNIEEDKVAATATVHLQLIFSDGVSSESYEEVAMSEDYGDKAMTQAVSMAYKYAITRKFCILTADTVDPDSRNPERGEDQPPVTPKETPKKPLAKTPAKQNEDEAEKVEQWKLAIKGYTTIEELTRNYNAAKAYINNTPEVFAAFKTRKEELNAK